MIRRCAPHRPSATRGRYGAFFDWPAGSLEAGAPSPEPGAGAGVTGCTAAPAPVGSRGWGALLDVPGADHPSRSYSEATAREIDCAVREIVDRMFHKATEILSQQRAVLHNAADALLQKETLTGEDLVALRKATPPNA